VHRELPTCAPRVRRRSNGRAPGGVVVFVSPKTRCLPMSAFIPSAWRPWVGLTQRVGPERGSRPSR
jgi:hypothetical protein